MMTPPRSRRFARRNTALARGLALGLAMGGLVAPNAAAAGDERERSERHRPRPKATRAVAGT